MLVRRSLERLLWGIRLVADLHAVEYKACPLQDHVADVPGRHEPGTGEINYPNIFATTAELRYDGYVGLEFTSTTTAAEALAKVKAMAGM